MPSTSRDRVLSDSRSGARPLGNSDPGPRTRPLAEVERTGGPRNSAEFRQSFPEYRSRSARRAPAAPSSPSPRSSPSTPSRSRTGARRTPNYGRTAQQFTSPDFSNYQGVILAEFVVAELLVSATPIATSKADASSGQYMSPYVGQDMVKMLSIGFLYFLLELLAVGGSKTGKFAAWFGGLILLVVGLNEASTIAKVFGIFSGLGAAASSTAQDAAGNFGAIGSAAVGVANVVAQDAQAIAGAGGTVTFPPAQQTAQQAGGFGAIGSTIKNIVNVITGIPAPKQAPGQRTAPTG